jgi:hypothetical protein
MRNWSRNWNDVRQLPSALSMNMPREVRPAVGASGCCWRAAREDGAMLSKARAIVTLRLGFTA